MDSPPDLLVVPVGSPAVAGLAAALPTWHAPASHMLKAVNSTSILTLSGAVVGPNQSRVPVAGNDTDAKATLPAAITARVGAVDVGALRREHGFEAVGFVQLTAVGLS